MSLLENDIMNDLILMQLSQILKQTKRLDEI